MVTQWSSATDCHILSLTGLNASVYSTGLNAQKLQVDWLGLEFSVSTSSMSTDIQLNYQFDLVVGVLVGSPTRLFIGSVSLQVETRISVMAGR